MFDYKWIGNGLKCNWDVIGSSYPDLTLYCPKIAQVSKSMFEIKICIINLLKNNMDILFLVRWTTINISHDNNPTRSLALLKARKNKWKTSNIDSPYDRNMDRNQPQCPQLNIYLHCAYNAGISFQLTQWCPFESCVTSRGSYCVALLRLVKYCSESSKRPVGKYVFRLKK